MVQLCESVELVPVAPYYKETSFFPTLEANKWVGGRDTEKRKKERTIIARVTLASKCIYCNFCNSIVSIIVEKTRSSDNIFSTAFLKP